MSSIFTLSGTGRWFEYRPFNKFELPRLQRMPRPARFENRDRTTEITRYRLVWPGQDYNLNRDPPQDMLPEELIRWWATGEKWGKLRGHSGKSVTDWLKQGPFPGTPDTWAENLQYHLAVNWNHYAKFVDPMPEIPVCGLPHHIVQSILKTEFAINEQYESTIRYLDWLGTSMQENPMLDGRFDTDIRDSLGEISIVTIRKFFLMVGDCIYNEKTQRWARGGFKMHWAKLACYLWWVGRTGCGLYDHHAGISQSWGRTPTPNTPADVKRLWEIALDDKNHDHLDRKRALRDAVSSWDYSQSRKNSREGGEILIKTPDDLMRIIQEAAKEADVDLDATDSEHPPMPYMRDGGTFHWVEKVGSNPAHRLDTSAEALLSDHFRAARRGGDGDGQVYFLFEETKDITEDWLKLIRQYDDRWKSLELVELNKELKERLENLPDE